MAELPHMPLATDAYLGDTRHLSTLEHGAYLLLLMIAWRCRGRPQLANDDKVLARCAGLDPRTWQRVKPNVMAFWMLGDDGFWTQAKQLKVREVVNKNVENQRNKAAKRWSAKPLENNDTGDAVASAGHMPDGCQPNPNPSITPKSPSGKAPRKGKIPPGYGDAADPVYADFLANIWEKRWQRPGNNPALAFGSYVQMKDADRTAAKSAIERCAKVIVANSSAPNYRPMMVSWLNNRGWEVDAGEPVAKALDWAKLVAHFKAHGEWLPGWGPRPGEPDCRVPAKYLLSTAA